MGSITGELLTAAVTTVIVAIAVTVVVVDVVDQGPDSQAPRIGRAALLFAPLRELRAGRRILGDIRTDDGIYYGLHVFQRYQPVASVSRSVPFEIELSRKSHLSRKPPSNDCTVYVCMCVYAYVYARKERFY